MFYQEKLLLLDKWLAQPLINKHITLKEFITSIANKEGKHPDPEYNKTLKLVRGVSLANIEIHPELIVTIGEYVSGLLNHIIRDLFSEKEIETWIKSK